MVDLSSKATPSPGELLSEETRRELLQTARAMKASASDVVSKSWDNWDVEGFEEGLPSAIDGVLDKLAGASKAQQITAGGFTGWVTGFLFNRLGKPVLYLAGGTLIIALFAEHQGYLKINWDKVSKDYSNGQRTVVNRINTLQTTGILARKNGRPWLRKLKMIAQSSPYLCGGFLGGVLVGLAS